MAIEWRETYSLGDAEIDTQHQTLFVLVNTLLAATDKSSLEEAVTRLAHYTRDHFAHEEAIMHKMGYPGMQAHIEQHNTLLSKLSKASELIANYTLNMANLESFLAAWLFNHLETLDAPLVHHIRRPQEAIGP